MPAPSKRSRSFRKVHRRVPGGKTSLHYKRKKPGKAKCGRCNAVLKGVPRERPYKMMSMAKTKKRPERPYGGVLCSKCMRELFKEKSRK